MKQAVIDLFRRPFVRNVATVATGAAASQAISVAFAPLLTRLYGPEAFGLQGIFVAVVGLISIVAALGYPTAIVLPKQASDALGLVRLSLLLGAATALLSALSLLLFGTQWLRLLNADAIAGYAYLVPLAVFASVLARVLGQWLIRQQAYRLTARSGALTTLAVSSAKAGLGLLFPSAGVLIATNTIGGLLGTLLTYLGWRRHAGQAATAQRPAPLAAVAREHRDFPLLRTPQDLINTFSQSLPLFLLAAYSGSGAAGRYGIAITVLGMPAALIGNAVMSVFYPRINQAIQGGEDARALIVKTTLAMAATGALPFLVVIVAGPWLFALAFGAAWQQAGVYAQWLSLWLFTQFINQPAVAAIPALRLQRGLLVYELFSTGSKALALWLGFVVFGSDVAAVALFAMSGVVAYLWLILWVIRRSGRPPTHPALGSSA